MVKMVASIAISLCARLELPGICLCACVPGKNPTPPNPDCQMSFQSLLSLLFFLAFGAGWRAGGVAAPLCNPCKTRPFSRLARLPRLRSRLSLPNLV
ncbi:hypothetical protein F5Y06DRAFT_110027 [Hypoxylon sp. FL0890]|nr:hypothetical protein F5Y06DRAFT_110027 [Hypoxylon sp. FL0890]